MAKVISPFELSGSIGDTTFCKNDFGVHMKMKGGPTKWQIEHLDRFANTRHNAAEWKRVTAGSKLMRAAMGSLRLSVKNMRLSGRMNSRLLAVLQADPVHDKGERVLSSGDLSLISGFEFNHQLSLDDALPMNPEHCYSLEAGKVVVNIPAFRLRKKKGLPADATHYRIVSGVITVDFDKKTYTHDNQVGELQAMGRTAGAAFCVEHREQPANEQGCLWLMGIEFYKMVNERPKLVKGGALRVMEWIGKASPTECVSVVPEGVVEDLAAESLLIDGPVKVFEEVSMLAPAGLTVEIADTAALLMEAFWETVDAVVTESPAEQDMSEVEVPEIMDALELIKDEDDEMLNIAPVEFERSLRVLLPMNGFERREMRSNEAGPHFHQLTKTFDYCPGDSQSS